MDIKAIENALRLRQEESGLNRLMDIHLVSVDGKGGAVVEAILTKKLLNPLGIAHGGTVYALCDVAAGTAAASHGRIAVTLDGSIHYYHPGRAGTKLTATAIERKYGRSTAVYMVEVRDGDECLIADAVFTMFYNGHKLKGINSDTEEYE